MNCHHTQTWVAVLSLMVLSAPSVHAAERASTQAALGTPKEAHALNPAQIAAIRSISRNVLAAKKSGADDGTDAAQLASLRASLDQLVDANLAPQNRMPITLQEQEGTEQRKSREKISNLRESARTDARAVAAQMRRRGEGQISQARSISEGETLSAGMPVGEQRAHLFQRLAQKLDAALVDDGVDRSNELRVLRDQLNATHGSLSNAPLSHGTPTLQAMPAGFVPPKNNDAAKE